MTLLNKVLRYFKIKKDKLEIEIATYDSLNDNNYFESFYPVILENSFKGTLVCLGDIHIKKNASFSGDLICRTCKIEGSFSGSLFSTEYTGVCKTAYLDARIVSASIFIESNAVVKGVFNITKDIINPEPIKKLNAIYKQSAPQNDEEQDAKNEKLKTIILRGKPLKAIPVKHRAPEIEIPAPEIKKQEVPVNTLTHPPGSKMNRSEEDAIPAQNGGWW